MNKAAIDKLKEQGIELIITVDNGIACAKEIAYAKSLGIETIVTDHHIPPEQLPSAIAVVDPHLKHCPSTLKKSVAQRLHLNLYVFLMTKSPNKCCLVMPIYWRWRL